MKTEFKICKHGVYGLSVTGLEQEGREYTDSPTQVGEFSYKDTVTLNILVPVNDNDEEDYSKIEYAINDHSEDLDVSILKFVKDGLFKVVHIILPKLEVFQRWRTEAEGEGVSGDSTHIYYKYANTTVYCYKDGSVVKIAPHGSLVTDLEYVSNVDLIKEAKEKQPKIYSGVQYTFSTCYLQQCFYEYAQEYLNKMSRCTVEDTRDRDIVFMTLHILKYLIDLGRYFEAQTLIQKVNKCSSICRQSKTITSNISSCGCSM